MPHKPIINIVWFKRDLRLRDHAALAAAAADVGTPMLLLYCFEPTVMAAPEYSERHHRFVWESVQDLQVQLSAAGQRLYDCHAEWLEVLACLHQHYRIKALYSHQETGLKVTFDRDRATLKWCRRHGIDWKEYGQDGVQRGIRHRRGWREKVDAHFKAPCLSANAAHWHTVALPQGLQAQLGVGAFAERLSPRPAAMQAGGERMAWRYLRSFMEERHPTYFKHISKPEASRTSCSRLSPYLAWGNVSARQVYQYASAVLREHKGKRHPLREFRSRVWWRSHFIQKLETEYQIEWEAINKGLKAIPREWDTARFEAWATGRTGFPMVDANMRCLAATGYTNFRMRAMLVSFATFPLWLPWKPVATELARLFLDFEPGIHFGQFQMQAGLTGYNTLRLYNPTAQVVKHDPDGVFIKKWLPELQNVPNALLAEPWKMTAMEQAFYGCVIGQDYPAPIVDFEAAARERKALYWEVRMSALARRELPRVLHLHCMPGRKPDDEE